MFQIDSEPSYGKLLYNIYKELSIKIKVQATNTPMQNPNAKRARRIIVKYRRVLRISLGLLKELVN